MLPEIPNNPQQNKEEFDWLLDRMAGARSILEIGSCLGLSLRHFAKRLAPGAKIRSIDAGVCYDLKDGKPVKFVNAPYLLLVVQDLDNSGFHATVMIGNSTWPQVVEWARERGPYDFIFIDGDHSYEGVKSDFENYAPMGKLIGLHDIAHQTYDVHRYWTELKSRYWTQEKIASEKGTGIVMQGPWND